MRGVIIAVFFGVLVVSIAVPQVYNLFQPGGDLAGAGSTWNSQIIANNAITTAKINASAVDLTTKVTGLLPVTNGGIGVGTLTGLALGNGTSAFSVYPGTNCTNQFPRSLSAAGVATCATVANADLANSSVTINGTSVALGGTRTLALASADFVNQGTTTTLLHGNAAGNPSFGAVSLTTDASGTLQAAQFPALTSEVTTPGGSLATTITKSISPTWTGNHTFTPSSGTAINITKPAAAQVNAFTFGQTGQTSWLTYQPASDSSYRINDQGGNDVLLLNAGAQAANKVLATPNGSAGAISLRSIVSADLPASSVTLSGITGSIGGGALVAGQCTSGTVAITGSTTSMVALTDPNTYPGDGTIWDAQITANGTATVKVCAIIALTPTASTYNVRVLQ